MKINDDYVLSLLEKDLEIYKHSGRAIEYPIDVEDFANVVFGLDIQYVDFDEEFQSETIDTKDIYGALYPDDSNFKGMSKVVLINTNRNIFKVGDYEIPKELYNEASERQTIAHEVGHYSKFVRDKLIELPLFEKITYDQAPNIFLRSQDEVFANKYARNLMMPETEVKKLKSELKIKGSLNLQHDSEPFIKKFDVTRFMLEVRLSELKISFSNGLYIGTEQRTKYQAYSESDLLTLLKLAKEYKGSPNYTDSENIVEMYNRLTGQDRASGPIYMVYWRIHTGKYDDKYESVLELRLKYMSELNDLLNKNLSIEERLKLEKVSNSELVKD